jgi:hypothetical protein
LALGGFLHEDAGAAVLAGRSFDVQSLLPRTLLQQRACGRTMRCYTTIRRVVDLRELVSVKWCQEFVQRNCLKLGKAYIAQVRLLKICIIA